MAVHNTSARGRTTSSGLHQADMCVYGQREAEEGQGGMIGLWITVWTVRTQRDDSIWSARRGGGVAMWLTRIWFCTQCINDDAGCSGFADNLARAHKQGEDGKDDMVGRRGTERSTIAQKKCTQINEKSCNPRVLKQWAWNNFLRGCLSYTRQEKQQW